MQISLSKYKSMWLWKEYLNVAMCFTNRIQPHLILGIGLPEDEELGFFCPPEDVLLKAFSNLFVRKGRDIFM